MAPHSLLAAVGLEAEASSPESPPALVHAMMHPTSKGYVNGHSSGIKSLLNGHGTGHGVSTKAPNSIKVSNGHTNGIRSDTAETLPPGIYVPTLCFFDAVTEDLDLATITTHAVRLARTGIAGLAVQGSNGEAVHLSTDERRLVTRTTRTALDTAGFASMPLIVGCGAQSTRETIALCHDAARAGGDFALVLPPAYNRALFAPDSVRRFFVDVADASPIPLLVYNFPSAAAGTDLSSDLIADLARHRNIRGCKLTCGNTGKLARIAAATRGSGFAVLGGSADFALPTLAAGGHGIIGGLANVAPRACVEVARRWNSGDVRGAREVQEVVARADWAAIEGGIVGCKAALRAWFGYGGFARRPLPRGEEKVWAARFAEVLALEGKLGPDVDEIEPDEQSSEGSSAESF